MRLLDTKTRELVELDRDIPPYAILSHTWENNEVIFEDFVYKTVETKSPESISKVEKSCERALLDGYQYIWIDTCCIDKRSSAELSEAINSMYVWYRDAAVCYAFLRHAPDDVQTDQNKAIFSRNKWFMRGWTLQELLAPQNLIFYSGDWVCIGDKSRLSPLISKITGIDVEILLGERSLQSASIARRMSWAAKRKTTREEDRAYCLMGVFSVNMPMLYGEGGEKAFLRLQEEIMKDSDDQSLFAWVDTKAQQGSRHGLLAPSPANFELSTAIVPYAAWENRQPYSMSNRGLKISLHMTARGDGLYVAALDCPVPPDYADSSFLAIYLEKVTEANEEYARVDVDHFGYVRQRGPLRDIYVRQKLMYPTTMGVFPHHIVQLRNGPSTDVYQMHSMRAIGHEKSFQTMPMRQSARDWVPVKIPINFELPKGPKQLAAAVIFTREDGECLVVLIGSAVGLDIAFGAIQCQPGQDLDSLSWTELDAKYQPSTAGRFETEYHSVRVSAEVTVYNSCKYYLVDIGIEAIKWSSRLAEIADALKREYEVMTGTSNNLTDIVSLALSEDAIPKPKEDKKKFWRRRS